ncbi:DNA cytosine methyltransferase [Burkholderia singularis]|uniref:DNA cytosine methyltransferase n=1 Tax=Burkholderia singularis TaxID=1503053 RepID=UPI000B788EF6|nr:DNA cytosine methyltransferase [Burkholderia singularis]
MAAYYNELDPYAAQWLRNLIAAGHIAPGDVDERSIEDVRPDDLRAYDQCHFFAGIGVWSYALRRAGWPEDRPVWTGSCPCQPFSAAGKGLGFDDERHLWPAWHWLIGECRPSVIFGEQVASKGVEPWIDLVHADMEALEYAFGCIPFPSAGVGAPHIRDRAYWMAYADHARSQRRRGMRERAAERAARQSGVAGRLAEHHEHRRTAQTVAQLHDDQYHAQPCSGSRGVADADSSARRQGRSIDGGRDSRSDALAQSGFGGDGLPIELADATGIGFDGRRSSETGDGRDAARIESERLRFVGRDEPAGPTNGFWRAADWLLCRDEKWRPVEPGSFPLVDGSAGRLGRVRADQERLTALLPRKDQGSRQGRLRGYGNAINAEAATQFILAAREYLNY